METKDTDIIIISGLSGSGKSVALRSLEDIGHYCIDNLPAVLLLDFTEKLQQNRDLFTADLLWNPVVSIDSRNRHFLSELEANLSALEKQGIRYRILFLQAKEQKLVHRYSETRRKHPLTDTETPLVEGIRQEWALLRPLYDQAEKVIDTTDTTPHELRGLVRDFAGGGLAAGPLFLIESFGFKNGTPKEADFVFDVRCLPNPYWEKDLAPLTGLDRPVQDFFREKPEVHSMTTEIFNFLSRWLPGFTNEDRSYITVGIGCTGGQHRSVFISEQLRTRFSKQGTKVQVRHRELVE